MTFTTLRLPPRFLAVASALLLLAGSLAWTQPGTPAGQPYDAPQQNAGQGDPSNLTATASGVGQVTLTWTPAPNATTHWIWSVRSNGSDGKWTDGGADGGEVLTGLVAGADYWFIVIATRGAGPDTTWSGWSNWASATTRDTERPPAPQRYSAISAGDLHTCGLKLDGGVDCFGSDGRGQSTPPAGEFLQVAAGGAHTCGVKADGTVACWGSAAVKSPPATLKFIQVSSGESHACGLTAWPGGNAPHRVICWSEATGLGRNEDFEASSGSPITSISAGGNHNCSLWNPNSIRCWGSNESLQLARGSARAVSAGGAHTCWLNANGIVDCVGNNASGQSTSPAPAETDVDQNSYTFTAVSAGSNHTCAIEDDGNALQTKGTARCWGNNDAGQSTPPGGVVFVQVSAGAYHTCGLKADGTVRCWGDNSYGQAPNTR